ncbi:TspO/MBR family protein [Tunturiibacter empetritectus]|uniref:Tryptophan-rich sensory protein n=2 Tax=Tunturiibacter TaxID=3154218 RepID=A0A852VKU1_9BACT|nr:TspO/MBR family protein [Edaphobacter lichenicola]NYF91869.1 tryptophan-rich sensory protein [Edaphobacter lichenicola]
MIASTPRQTSRADSISVLLGLLFVCYAVAALGALVTAHEVPAWYATLSKPNFSPPNWIFAPVWTVLYGLMAVAAWLVWRTPTSGSNSTSRRSGLILFALQLLLNFLWTPVFFRFHQLLPALVVILCLWGLILLTALRFWKVDRLAGGLMLPYLVWVTFATALNYEIYRLN